MPKFENPPDFIGLNNKAYADFDDKKLDEYNDEEFIHSNSKNKISMILNHLKNF